MAKSVKFVLIIVFTMGLIDCSNNEHKIIPIENAAKLINTYKITNKDYLLSDFINDCRVYKDSVLFFSELFSKNLYKYNKLNNILIKIGGYGKGPGEFLMPGSIAINGDSIFINDMNTPSIQLFDITGKYIKNIIVNGFVTGNSILFSNSKLYFLNSGTPYEYYITSSDGEKIYKVPKCFTYWNYGIRGLSLESFNHTLYFMNPYEMKIYYYDITKNVSNSIKIENFEKVFNFEKYYNENIPVQAQKKINTENFYVRPINFRKLIVNNKLYFIVSILNERKKFLYNSILDENGKIAKVIITNKMGLLTTYKNIAIFIQSNDNGSVNLYEYEFFNL